MERELIVREEELLTCTVVVIPALAQSNLFRGFSLDLRRRGRPRGGMPRDLWSGGRGRACVVGFLSFC